MQHLTLKVGGMTCTGCVSSVTRVLKAVPGVSEVSISLEQAQAQIDYDPALAKPEDLCAAVEQAGFDASI
jgi:copper chaperone